MIEQSPVNFGIPDYYDGGILTAFKGSCVIANFRVKLSPDQSTMRTRKVIFSPGQNPMPRSSTLHQ